MNLEGGEYWQPMEAMTPVEPLALFEILMRENADSLTAFLRASLDDPQRSTTCSRTPC